MDWNLFGGLAIALFLIRWDQNNIKLIHLLKETLLIGIFVLILSISPKVENLSFSVFNYIPEQFEIWAGALLFISFIGALTHRGWRIFNSHQLNRHQ